MQIWKSVLAVVTFALSTFAVADTGCQDILDEAARYHVTQSSAILSRHDTRIEALLGRAANDKPAKFQSSMRQTIDDFIERRNLEDAWRAYVDNVTSELTNAEKLLEAGISCETRRVVHMTFKANREAYEAVLDQIQVDVEERLEIENLGADEGLVVIAFNTSEFIHIARIDRRGSIGGHIRFGPIPAGEYFRVVRAKAGTYAWEEITRRMQDGRYMYRFDKRDYTFVVEAGKLNYSGVFLFETMPGAYFKTSLNDRLTIVVTALEQRYPGLLERYEFANGLYPDDRFTDFYLAEKRALSNGADNAR